MSRKIKDLVLVVNDNKNEFNNIVSNKIKEGYELCGDIQFQSPPGYSNHFWTQAVIKVERVEENEM